MPIPHLSAQITYLMSEIRTGARAMLSHPSVYDLFQNLMGARSGRRDFSESFVRAPKGARILDVGCGTAQILAYLPPDVEYWGFDVSPEYIAYAAEKYGERGRFVCRELTRDELAALPKFDVVMASGLLHHLDDGTAGRFLELAAEALQMHGRLVTIDPCLSPGQNPIARYLVSRDRGQHVRTAEDYRALASRHFQAVDGTLRHRLWIPYTHWIMECHISR